VSYLGSRDHSVIVAVLCKPEMSRSFRDRSQELVPEVFIARERRQEQLVEAGRCAGEHVFSIQLQCRGRLNQLKSFHGKHDSSYFVDLERLNSGTALKLCESAQRDSRRGGNKHQELCLFLLREASQRPPEPGDLGVAVLPTVKSTQVVRR
jgi:hypothetical protein